MARDGLFFRGFANVDPDRGTPARAVALQAGLAVLLVLTGTFDQIIIYFMVPTIAFLAFTITAVFVLRRGSATRPPLSTPGYPVSPSIFVGLIVLLLFLLISNRPRESLIGLFIVLLGIPVSWWVVKQARPSTDRGVGRPLDKAGGPTVLSTETKTVTTTNNNLPA
jgi:APA family basic amino acid/polyamine antiporter